MEQVKVEGFQLAGIEIRTSNQEGKAAKDIPELWQRFISEGVFQKIPNRLNDKVYCVYMEYEGDHSAPYTTFIGCEIGDEQTLPEGMTSKKINASRYQKFSRKGKLSEIVIDQWMKIWNMDLPRAYQEDFEVYENMNQDFENSEVDIFVGLTA